MFENDFATGASIGLFFLGIVFSITMIYFTWYFGRTLINSFERLAKRRFIFKLEKFDWNMHDKEFIDKKIKAESK